MSKTLAPSAAALALLVLVAAGSARAAPVVPYAGRALAPPPVSVPLVTGLLPLGIALSTFGVDPSELSTVGPTASTTAPSPPHMLIVDDDGLDCPNWQFNRIQDAVDAATPGAMIKVCRGTYQEQVTIPAGKNDLTLFSVGDLQAVIKAPPVMFSPKAIVLIYG